MADQEPEKAPVQAASAGEIPMSAGGSGVEAVTAEEKLTESQQSGEEGNTAVFADTAAAAAAAADGDSAKPQTPAISEGRKSSAKSGKSSKKGSAKKSKKSIVKEAETSAEPVSTAEAGDDDVSTISILEPTLTAADEATQQAADPATAAAETAATAGQEGDAAAAAGQEDSAAEVSPTAEAQPTATAGEEERKGSGKKGVGKKGGGSVKSDKKSKGDGTSRASSTAGSKGGATGSASSKKKGGGKGKKKAQAIVMTGLPEDVFPIFLSTKTQELFNIKADIDVTSENLFKNINKTQILDDFYNRAAISDFHPFKQQIMDYPGESLLLVYDPDFKHGQNFYIALSEQARQALQEMLEIQDEGEDDEGDEDVDDVIMVHYTGPVAREWISLGSEQDIQPDTTASEQQRRFLMTSAVRVRREFGRMTDFSDRDVADIKDGYVECPPYIDQNFEINRIELDKPVQAVPVLRDMESQTDWKYPRNAAVQYIPRELSAEQISQIETTEDYKQFIISSVARMEVALQQNNIMDVFIDDWARLASEDSELGSKADNHLKEFQSFTDLQVSKDRMITAVDWHPSIKGVVAVSLAERLTFDERVDARHKISMKPSVILVWSFTDPIHPQLLLEAPDDILVFKFCPTDPNIVAGGCVNGQVILWDISDYSERLRLARSGKFKETPKTSLGFEDEGSGGQTVVRYAAVSAIEHSHRAAIHDLLWVPDHFEANRSGIPIDNKSGQCCQLITCSTDQTMLWWDIRPPPNLPKPETKKSSNPFQVPLTFKHLDLTWKPLFKINLFKADQGGDHAPTRFSIAESHRSKGGRASIRRGGGGEGEINQSGSGNPVNQINTWFYAGTEDGEIVYLDWVPKKDQDSGKIVTGRPLYYHTLHDGPVLTLQRSPFFSDLVLCVGGWSFTIWKEGVSTGPLLRSPMSSRRMTSGHWSPSRPSVFYISLQDGGVEIWDLLDKTHEPCITQSISSTGITCLSPIQLTNKQHLLAVCDDRGTLHVLTIPWSLRQPTPNERQGMQNYIDREVKRREFVTERWEYREREKARLDIEAKKKAGVAPQPVATDDEIELKMKREYDQYLADEQAFLRQLETNNHDDITIR